MADLDELLAGYTPDVRDLMLRVRALVLDVVPDAIEQVDLADRLVGYGLGLKMSDLICTILPTKVGVTLGLYSGATLPDPAGLLAGTGKRHRHVKIKTAAEVDAPALRALLEAVVARHYNASRV